MTFKKGTWIKIVKNTGVSTFNRLIGNAFPIIRVEKLRLGKINYLLPINPDTLKIDFEDLSLWFPNELVRASKAEIRKAKPKLIMELL